MQKLHIILQKHAFCKEKERDKNKNKTKKQRDRLKKLSSLHCEILLRWRLKCRIPTTLPKCSKLSNPRYFILMKCFPICVLRVMKILSDDDLNNYFQFYSSLWCFDTVIYHLALSLEVPGNQTGPRGTAPNECSGSNESSGAAPRNPMAPCLETPWRRASKPLRRPSKPHGAVPRNPRCAAPINPWGQILRPKFSSFGGF